jgi:hypothetical protein
MPETPNFDQFARRIVNVRADLEDEDMASAIAEQLRLIWNARGAADLAMIDTQLPGASLKQLDRAIRTLDR